MSFLRKNRGYVDYIYFVKWDRFSRNVAEAYVTINNLRNLGVEPQAIEQPLDFEVPETKIMLAVYLAAPEVDNDRRALNIFNGVRRAKKEGRWLGSCLRGYKNLRDENNKPIIAPEGGLQEQLVKKAFSEFATGLYNIEELRIKFQKEGLKCNRNSFWMLLRNKGYIGKVFVPAFKSEPAHWVNGQHEALIDEVTFYAVQDILEGRKKKLPTKSKTMRDEFPLRGFLTCPRCGNNLTGSASRGKLGGRFFYYHCTKGCKERQKAIDVNQAFTTYLESFTANKESITLMGEILKQRFKDQNKAGKTELEKVQAEIAKQNQRLKNGRELMLDGEITASEFKQMRYELEERIARLNSEETKLKQGFENYASLIDGCIGIVKNLPSYYQSSSTQTKQRIVGSVFPEKLVFENKKYRTQKINSAFLLLCSNGAPSCTNKKGKKPLSSVSSLKVDSGYKKSNPDSLKGIINALFALKNHLIIEKT